MLDDLILKTGDQLRWKFINVVVLQLLNNHLKEKKMSLKNIKSESFILIN
jgi:hypothetical protein